MNPTLSYLLGRRMWLVPSVNVWGAIAGFTAELLLTESDAGARRVLFGSFPVGGAAQRLSYGDLVDIRGNPLPSELTNPKVLVLPKNDVAIIVSGSESATAVTLAKTSDTDRNGVCDLLIIEMG
jgi:hypothetical protein